MVVIRLSRVGKKNSPAYRVVVAEKRRAVKRKFIEVIGHYNPTRDPKEIKIDKERAVFWIEKGAQPSPTVRNLMADLGVIKKSEKVNIKYARDMKKKDLKVKKEDGDKTEAKESAEKKEVPTEETENPAENKAEAKEAPAGEIQTPDKEDKKEEAKEKSEKNGETKPEEESKETENKEKDKK